MDSVIWSNMAFREVVATVESGRYKGIGHTQRFAVVILTPHGSIDLVF